MSVKATVPIDIAMRGGFMYKSSVETSVIKTFETPRGLIILEGPVRAAQMADLDLEDGLDNFRRSDKQKEALMEIADSPDGQVFIARHDQLVIAYISFHYPDQCSRWINHPCILELGAIEVSPNWRKLKLGLRLLELAIKNPIMDEHIVITIEYCWHWDLDATGLDVWSYQKMLARLFGSVGFERVYTDDPDILEHLCNVLMAKIGSKVTPDEVKLFRQLQFTGKRTIDC